MKDDKLLFIDTSYYITSNGISQNYKDKADSKFSAFELDGGWQILSCLDTLNGWGYIIRTKAGFSCNIFVSTIAKTILLSGVGTDENNMEIAALIADNLNKIINCKRTGKTVHEYQNKNIIYNDNTYEIVCFL